MDNEKFNDKNGLNADLRSIDSIYRMIVVAGLRSKQLFRGATPRVVSDPSRRRFVSIALEEARRGLIPFRVGTLKKNGLATTDILAEKEPVA